jgi:hypothetical protein
MTVLKAPMPYFGGKFTVASMVWDRLGNPPNYVEPFFGSGAVLLARPNEPGIETANDLNAWLANFWRALRADPDGVAGYASDPVSELDLHARGDWLFYRKGVDSEFVERLRGDPDYYCVKSAGWWVWGQSSWIGNHWGRVAHNSRKGLDGNSIGVVHALPHLGDAGKGVNRQLPHLGNAGQGYETTRELGIREYFRKLAERLCRVRICCGDWKRVLGPSPTFKLGMTGIFIDPPYGTTDRDAVYGEEDSVEVAAEVRYWCLANGANPLLRIALCGYAGEGHEALEAAGWNVHHWIANGGYGNQGEYSRGAANARKERIWFSPACIAQGLFEVQKV